MLFCLNGYAAYMKHKPAMCGILFALAAAFICNAALLKPLSIEELSSKADVVVHGKVVSQTCQRDATGQIYTSVKLDIEEVWKGHVDTNSFRIVHSGGVLGDEIETCSAQVEYRIGEEVVALVALNDRGEGITLGLVQGKFEVSTDKISGQKFARNMFHGKNGNLARQANSLSTPTPGVTTGDGRLGLVEFRQRVTGGVK